MIEQREKIYISSKNALIFLGDKKISNQYWNEIWSENLRRVHNNTPNRIFIRILTKYVPNRKCKILEAGCGNARYVRVFNHLGYDCYGIDNATKTVKKLNEDFPDLKIYNMDVRHTMFNDEQFSVYWSIGVIEHFIDGYEQVIYEARRILKCNGFVFMSFPYISPIRFFKIYFKQYKIQKNMDGYCRKYFNQYVLSIKQVISLFRKYGFNYITAYKYNGILGWVEEIALFKSLMKNIYLSKSNFVRPLRFLLNHVLSIIMSHSILLIFKKNQ